MRGYRCVAIRTAQFERATQRARHTKHHLAAESRTFRQDGFATLSGCCATAPCRNAGSDGDAWACAHACQTSLLRCVPVAHVGGVPLCVFRRAGRYNGRPRAEAALPAWPPPCSMHCRVCNTTCCPHKIRNASVPSSTGASRWRSWVGLALWDDVPVSRTAILLRAVDQQRTTQLPDCATCAGTCSAQPMRTATTA